jgi:hypothetical protein
MVTKYRMIFEIENTKRRNVGFTNPLFLLGRALESHKLEILVSYLELKMVKNSMENISKRWNAFPMQCFLKLFSREQMVSPRIIGKHNNTMNFFLFIIQCPCIYRTIARYFITCTKCECEAFRGTSHPFNHPKEYFGSILGSCLDSLQPKSG